MKTKYCSGCGAALQESMRICPSCGGRSFAATPPAAPTSGSAHAPKGTPPPPPVGVPVPPAAGARARWQSPHIPLIQARMLNKRLAYAAIAAVAVFFGLTMLGTDRMADYLADHRSPSEDSRLTSDSPEYRSWLDNALPDGRRDAVMVRTVGEKLVSALGADTPFHYHFHVVPGDTINAFAMPGGEVFVFTGLVQNVGSEERLAAVLAHEIEHVEQRHGIRTLYRRAGRMGLFAMVLGMFGDDSAFLAEGLTSLKYMRQYETEADLKGAALMERAGIPRQAMVDMLNWLDTQGAGNVSWLSDHPDSKERARRVAAAGK